MCVDLAYSWSEAWVKKYEEGYWIYEYLLYIVSLAFYVGTGMLVYSNYNSFPCASTQNMLNIVIVIVMSVVNLCPFNAKPSVLVCGALCLLVTYFSWSALMNEVGDDCNLYAEEYKNKNNNNSASSFLQTEGILGIILIIVALAYITFGESDP